MASNKARKIVLTGNTLKVEDIYEFCREPDATIYVARSALGKIKKAQMFLEKELDKKVIYGVNTGFGPMASHIIGRRQLVDLQYNLIRSHAVGMGEPIDPFYSLAAMIVRLNTLVKGYSGVSPELTEHLAALINHRIIPVIPEHGAVGTSGDLVQLAHIALALIGEGEVFFKGKRQPTSFVFKQLRLKPYKLRAKEGLSLINGTSVMTGIAAIMCAHARRLVDGMTRTGALALELVHSFDDGLDQELHAVRPHRGQQTIARNLRKLLASSSLLRERGEFQKKFHVTDSTHEIPEDVQEIYSLRCIPQIIGPVHDALSKTRKDVETEMNSVTDNPVIDVRRKVFLHGGNFHGDVIGATVDQLKLTLVKLTLLSERRIHFFLNHKINRKFPPFLNLKKPGLNLALQGLQFVATSTAAQNQTLAFPHYVHSISTNADNQDVVSMGTDAALLAMKVIDNAYILLAIELITLAQAVDVAGEHDKLSRSSKALHQSVRKIFPAVTHDRVMSAELPEMVSLVRRNLL